MQRRKGRERVSSSAFFCACGAAQSDRLVFYEAVSASGNGALSSSFKLGVQKGCQIGLAALFCFGWIVMWAVSS
ncbi:hypothetical protein ATPR_3039 [Acetobacter tropicalis NBRC 101654]|uniref:Uncharacterized protein n=1 Tax=Acetobacter tropicalis NBRC 101654 TaxID=749388 RepID=F7VI40_9PROT|nr:hypothetical protein ATPR_3039 [Acetobacter tropicalis NBRC 101654]